MPSAPGRNSRPLLWMALAVFNFGCYTFGNSAQDETPSEMGPPASQFNSEVALAWFKLQLKLAKETPGCSPPVVSRAFGYAGVTLYEAVVPGIPTHQSLIGQLNGLAAMPQAAVDEEYHWPTVANSALTTICQRLFVKTTPLNLAAMAALEEKFNRQFQARLSPEVFNRSVAWGKTVAEAVYTWSRTDGGNKGYSDNFPFTYTPPVAPGLWVPTPPFLETLYPSRALQPYWGKNRPFVLKSGSDCAPLPHPAYSDQPGSAFYTEAMEVYTATKNITSEQRAIAQFWADNPGQSSTPPGHSISILNQILAQKNATLDVAAEAYAKVGMAVSDAFIACWHAKYQYNLVRPITYINRFIDASWKPPLNTPPFPEFPSGHSVQSGAFAQVMTDLFGETAFVDHTHDTGAIEQMMKDLFGAVMYLGQEHHGRGLAPRRFNSFFEAANEAAISRLYGGIHYRAAIENGLAQGKCVGQKVSALQFKKSSNQYSVISKQSSVSSNQHQAASGQQPATSNQHFTAELQIDLSGQSATVKPLDRSSILPTETAVTDLIRLQTSNVYFNAQNKIFSFDATLTNISSQLVFTPLKIVITNLRPSTVRIFDADGGGNRDGAFFQYTDFVGLDNLLQPNETSVSRKWQFFNPELKQFSFTVIIEGELQRATEPPAPIVTQLTSPTNQLNIQVTGSADPNAQVEIFDGVDVTTTTANATGAFTATVQLEPNRENHLFVTAINAHGRSAPTPVEVIHDNQPPVFFIDVPNANAELTNDMIAVTGRVSDVLSGFMGLTVNVNGQPANVAVGIGTNGTFERTNVPLAIGANTITVTATDELGNTSTKQVTVTRVDATGQPQMVVVSGNGQSGQVNTELAQPIVVRVTKADGSPFANKTVTFDVIRSDGRLSASLPVGDETMMLQVFTDANGLATAYWKLGSDAGQGNNRVSVTSTSIAGTILFCASATPAPAVQINVDTGNNQYSETGGPAAEPLRIWVSDNVNGIANIPVTFIVAEGGGKINERDTVTVNTDITGHAEVNFTLGSNGGNNIVEATFAGNIGEPARFVIFGIKRNPAQPTSFTGLVLDNANQPIQGATCVLKISNVTLPAQLSDISGQFSFMNIPSGPAHLFVDGLTATALNGQPIPQGSFPALAYETLVVPNAENRLPTPVLLPPLNPNNARVYDGTQDVELTVEGIEGLKMIVKKGSMKRADGSIPSPSDPATISLNQVHFDKIPMPMPNGVAPLYSGTLQPMGATFDPPVEVIFPNIAGMPAGANDYFLSFNHETHRFEIVATGYITTDGSSFVTDAGSGISVAGWHAPPPPPPPTGSASGTVSCDNISISGISISSIVRTCYCDIGISGTVGMCLGTIDFLTATGTPSGGTFLWEHVSGNATGILGPDDQSTVVIVAFGGPFSRPSVALNDEAFRVTYTTPGPDRTQCSETYRLTVFDVAITGPDRMYACGTITLTASARPTGGTYSWERVSGTSANIIGSSTGQSVMIQAGSTPSPTVNDHEFKVTYRMPNGAQCSATHRLTVRNNVDLVIHKPKVIDPTESAIPEDAELSVGAQTFVNLDNDDTDSQYDTSDLNVAGEDEMIKLTLRLEPNNLTTGTVRLIATEGSTNIKVWTTATKGTEYALGTTISVPNDFMVVGNALTKELWVEGISPHMVQRGTKLKMVYSGTPGCEDEDEVALTILGIESIVWKGRGNSVNDDNNLDNDPNYPVGLAPGTLRVFTDKRVVAGAVEANPRDKVDVEVSLSVNPVEPVEIYFDSFDVDDPTASIATLDDETNDEDNRGVIIIIPYPPIKSGVFTDEVGGVLEKTFANRVETLEFQTTRQPGDNFRIVGNGDRDFLADLENDDSAGATDEDKQRVVNSHISGTLAQKEIREANKYASNVLTVWRFLHIEQDAMEAVQTSGPQKNSVSGNVTGIAGNGTQPQLVTVDVNLDDGSPNLSTGPGNHGRFENGKIKLGANLVPTADLFGNGNNFIFKSAGINIPFTVTRGPAIITGQVIALTANTDIITVDRTLTPGAFVGGTLNIAGTVFSVSNNTANTITTTVSISIPFELWDDDSFILPEFPILDVVITSYKDAYIHVIVDDDGDPDGGGNPNNNKNNVPFILNIDITNQATKDAMNQTNGIESDGNRKDDFWIAYVLNAYQPRSPEDVDPDAEDSATGLTPSIEPRLGSVILPEIEIDLIRLSRGSALDRAGTVAHEIGHQFNLNHDNGDFFIMGPFGNGATTFHPNDLAKLRARIKSPGK